MNCNSLYLSLSRRLVHVHVHVHLQASNQSPRFSSYPIQNRRTSQNKNKQQNALRLVDLVTPKTNLTLSPPKAHLRLIEEFILTAPEQGSPTSLEKIPECTTSVGVRDAKLLSLAVSSCGSRRNLSGGVQHHCAAIKHGFASNVYVGTSLISFYSKCGQLDNAHQVFEEMPDRNVVSWTALIAGFAQEWLVDVCLEIFQRMRNSALRPNDFTFTSLLSACTGSGALGHGRSVHSLTIEMGFHSYVHISNALISLYCKCGAVEDALFVFRALDGKDTVSWNSMIAGYAQHGLVLKAIDLFEEMKKQNTKADAITFLGVLSSCRHAGLVKQGWFYFNLMIEQGVEPELDHYSCVVDLLGRAGLLEEARDVVLKMPIPPNAVIWGSLLSSSRLHGRVWLGIEAAESRLLLEPSCAATYLQLANLYASAGHWDHAARTRKLMKDKGLKTSPGYSWIEIKNVIYRFRADDSSKTRTVEVISVLDSLADHMMTSGYDPQVHEEELEHLYTI
ncbi:hypothetical protein UlMin_005308 [Ulmus minor]